ncbi:MAG: protein kinase [Isosphaeraceae bacterium]
MNHLQRSPCGRPDLFAEALNRNDLVERAAFLDRACAGNPGLRRRLEELLAVYAPAPARLRPAIACDRGDRAIGPAGAIDRADPEATVACESALPLTDATGEHRPAGGTMTLARPDPDATEARQSEDTAPRAARTATDEAIGTVIADRYTLLGMIGEGGMGSVYLAEQTKPVRRQVALKLIKTGMDSRGVLARFDAERQALALMDHPNIARIYDGGLTPAGRPFFVMELVEGIPLTDYCDRQRLT